MATYRSGFTIESILTSQTNQQSKFLTKAVGYVVLSAAFIGMLIRPFTVEKPLISPYTLVELEPLVVPSVPVKVKTKIETYVPQHHVQLPDFAAIYSVSEKKRQFFAFLTPHIESENKRLVRLHNWLINKRNQFERQEPLSVEDQQQIDQLFARYRIKHQSMSQTKAFEALLKCVDGLPVSLVLMQAANESAWGTSRFAKLGLNFFGKWCYSKGCGIVPRGRPVGKTYEVEAYSSVSESVKSYFKNINTNNAYSLLREIRYQLRENDMPLDAQVLATGLMAYSERGSHYVEEITNMINSNQRYVLVSE